MAEKSPLIASQTLFAPRLSRRHIIGWGFTAIGVGVVSASPAEASVSSLMCPPEAGSFGGDASGYSPPGAGVDQTGAIDYSKAIPDDGPGLRHLTMTNFRTGETFDRDFVVDGKFVQDAVDEFSHFGRDWRVNEVKPFNPENLDIVWNIWRRLKMTEPFNLNSGFRSPETNASLPGSATQSLHMQAMATDISTQTRTVDQIHSAAVSLKAGGVGKYTAEHFVHVDSGRVRYWGS